MEGGGSRKSVWIGSKFSQAVRPARESGAAASHGHGSSRLLANPFHSLESQKMVPFSMNRSEEVS